jgi:2-phospho-L-lactate guanylyltransferase
VRAALVVTDDAVLARTLAETGLPAVPDGDTTDLNAALWQGAAELARRAPAVRPVALCADLPALRAHELTMVLERTPVEGAAFLCDAAGTGTTLYTASDLARFRPRFGVGSRRTHQEAGAVEILGVDAPSVRRDVDVPDDLFAAAALGLGPRSRGVLLQHGLAQAG